MLKNDILIMVSEFFQRGKLPKGINNSYISLIPKKKGSISFGDYRPINLINGLYNMISNILGNRLKEVMNGIVSIPQSAFITGRYILD